MPQAPMDNPLLSNPNQGTQSGSVVSSALPNVANLTALASNNTSKLLNGMPSTSAARKANAVFGVGSGLAPGSDFLKTRLYDTYGQQVDERNQRGLQDFLALLSGTSGAALAERGQNNQASQFGQSLAQQRQQFADSLKQRQEEFNKSNDLALQQFGFQRDRYYSSLPKPSNHGTIQSIPNEVPGAPVANWNIQQRDDGGNWFL